MAQFLLLLIGALVVGAIVFGVAILITGDDPGIEGNEPDSQAVPLPATRPLAEADISALRFDTTIRGYRMAQVDSALRRAAYDIGYKGELIQVLEAEVEALREGRQDEADALRRARELASGGESGGVAIAGSRSAAGEAPAKTEPTTAESATAAPANAAPAAESDKSGPATTFSGRAAVRR
jgi:DivIVA domain-containing protein